MTCISPTAHHLFILEQLENLVLFDVDSIAEVLFGESKEKFSDYPHEKKAEQIAWLKRRWDESKDCKFIELALWAIPYTKNPSMYAELISSLPKECGETHDEAFLADAISQWITLTNPATEKVVAILNLYSTLADPWLVIDMMKYSERTIELIRALNPEIDIPDLPSPYRRLFIDCVNSKKFPHAVRMRYFNNLTHKKCSEKEVAIAVKMLPGIGTPTLGLLLRRLASLVPESGEYMLLKSICKQVIKLKVKKEVSSALIEQMAKLPKLVAKLELDIQVNPDHPGKEIIKKVKTLLKPL